MGSLLSREITEITSEHKRQMNKDNRKREEKERIEKEAMEKKLEEDTSKEKKRIEKELQTVRQNEMEKIEKEFDKQKRTQAELGKLLGEVEEEIRINNVKQIEEAKKAGLEQVAQEKKRLEEDKEKIVLKKEYIVQQMEKLSETQKAMKAERSEMVQKLEGEEIEKLQTHHEVLHKLNDEKNNTVREGENKKHRFAEDHRNLQIQLKEQHLKLNAVQMANAQELQTILNKEQIFEDFRRRCKRILSLFSTFKREFDQEETAINVTRDDIQKGKKLSYQAELSEVLDALRNLGSEVEGFDCSGSNDEEEFSKLREKTKTLIEKLLTALIDIQSRIIRYEISAPSTSQPNHSRTTSMCSDLELEDSDSALDSSPPSVICSSDKKLSSESNSFSIADLKQEAKGYISELNDIMLKFNVRASTAFGDALNSQFQRLSIAHSQTISQITNGPSTSSANQISSGTSIENRSQPSIEKARDSEPELVKEPIEESENEK